MQPMVLTIVFAENMLSVLMCEHKKLGANNFIGGKIEDGETMMEASYRELYEETGITPEDVELRLVRHEITTSPVLGEWDIYVTCGVLKHPVELREEKNKLFWADVYEDEIFLEAYGNGNCANYLQEARLVLADEHTRIIEKRNNQLLQMLRDRGATVYCLETGTHLNEDCPWGNVYIPIPLNNEITRHMLNNYMTDATLEKGRFFDIRHCSGVCSTCPYRDKGRVRLSSKEDATISKRESVAKALRDFDVSEVYYTPGLDFEADTPEGIILLPIEQNRILNYAIRRELIEDDLLAEDRHLSLLSVLPNDRDFSLLRNVCTEVLHASGR